MELSVEQLKPIIDLLKSEGITHFKFGPLEMNIEAVPDATIVPPAKTEAQVQAEDENMLFYSAE